MAQVLQEVRGLLSLPSSQEHLNLQWTLLFLAGLWGQVGPMNHYFQVAL